MPNWAKGYLRVRGRTADILDFIENEMIYTAEVYVGSYGVISTGITIDRSSYDGELDIPISKAVFGNEAEKACLPAIYIKGTRRYFIRHDIYACLNGLDEISTLAVSGFEAAWGVDVKPYREISEKYNLEIKIDVYERGMQFSQHIHVKDGWILLDEERTYDDWEWDCPCPDFGG